MFRWDIKTLTNFVNTVDDVVTLINQNNPNEMTAKLTILALKNNIKRNAAQCISINSINTCRETRDHLLQNYSDTYNNV